MLSDSCATRGRLDDAALVVNAFNTSYAAVRTLLSALFLSISLVCIVERQKQAHLLFGSLHKSADTRLKILGHGILNSANITTESFCKIHQSPTA